VKEDLNNKDVVLVLATRNAGKIGEIKLGLAGLPIRVTVADDYPGFPEVEETESTLRGNAALKSKALFEFLGRPSLADDTGLEVDALDGRPGVMSARYAGNHCSPADNRVLLMEELANVSQREARFRTVLAFTDASGTTFFEGVCEGQILSVERGTGGFGYDAIFKPEGSDLSFAEMSADRKNAISHRGHAISQFSDFMRDYGRARS